MRQRGASLPASFATMSAQRQKGLKENDGSDSPSLRRSVSRRRWRRLCVWCVAPISKEPASFFQDSAA